MSKMVLIFSLVLGVLVPVPSWAEESTTGGFIAVDKNVI